MAFGVSFWSKLGTILVRSALGRFDDAERSFIAPEELARVRDETRAFLGNDPGNFALTWEDLPGKLRTQQYVDIDPAIVIDEYRRI